MSWEKIVREFTDEVNLRLVLIGSIVTWDFIKVWRAVANKKLAAANMDRFFVPFEDKAQADSSFVIGHSLVDVVLKLAKLRWKFYPLVWNATKDYFGLEPPIRRAFCFVLIVDALEVVEKIVTNLAVWLCLKPTVREEYPVLSMTGRDLFVFVTSFAFSVAQVLIHSFTKHPVFIYVALKFVGRTLFQPFGYFVMSRPNSNMVPYNIREIAKCNEFEEDYVYVGKRPEPRANCVQVLCMSTRIVVNQGLIDALENEEQVTIFCRELGHWEHNHTYVQHFFTLIECLLDVVILLPFGSSKIAAVFNLDSGTPVVAFFVLHRYAAQTVHDLVGAVAGMANAHLEVLADDYALAIVKTFRGAVLIPPSRNTHLDGPWAKLAPKDPETFQFFDWYFGAIFYGQPTLQYRQKRVHSKKIRFSDEHQSDG